MKKFMSELKRIEKKNIELLPDLGEYLVERGYTDPFKFRSFSPGLLAEDQILGSIISGPTSLCILSKVEDYSLALIEFPTIFSLYLGFGSQSRADKILQRFRTEGLVVRVRPDKRYQTPNTLEWVTPLQYLNEYV
ncbi:MAG: hypothetical protein ACRDEA_20685 [Microcystaceae cyanobacterium]